MKLFILLLLLTFNQKLLAMTLLDQIDLFRCKQPYQIPYVKDLNDARTLFSQLLIETENATDINAELNKAGFKSALIKKKNVHWLLLQEDQHQCQGRGHILLNLSLAPENQKLKLKPVFLQAPHSFHDKYTASLVKKLFEKNTYQLAYFNNVHRYQKRLNKVAVSDLTRNNNNYLAVLADAFIAEHPDSMIVQIHGFSLKKRKSAMGKNANIILSQGHFNPTKLLYQLKNCFKQKFADKNSYLYPDDIRELGATKNTLGSYLVHNNYRNFIHIELDAAFRKELNQDPGQLEKFSQCLLGSFQ